MRLIVALLTIAFVSACGGQRSQSEYALVRQDDEVRQRQAVLNAEAILRGMAQARERQEQMARTAR